MTTGILPKFPREADVRGGTSTDCYKEKVMSEEGLQLTATKRG